MSNYWPEGIVVRDRSRVKLCEGLLAYNRWNKK